jgi:phosphoglycolate phosphatase
MLQSLADAKIPLHIATNKRQRPTSQILDALGWTSLFDLVLSPDSFNPALPSKAVILTKLLVEANLDAKDCLYIGDRLDDYNAALETGIPFALAEWGFEGDDSGFPADTIRLKTPDAGHLLSGFFGRA